MGVDRNEAGTRSAQLEERAARGQEFVLLVEDEAPLRTLLSAALERAGYRVVVLPHAGAVEAWRAGLDEPPALLLTDLELPGEQGRSLARRLRTLWPGLRVLFMSGQPDEAAQEGGDTFLMKPFRLGELLARVEATLAAETRG